MLEIGESIQDGLRREVREETGLDVEPVTLTGVYKNMTRAIIALVFRCTATAGHLTLNDEVTAFRWANPAEVTELADEAYAVRVLDALRDGSGPAVRQHDGTHVLDATCKPARLSARHCRIEPFLDQGDAAARRRWRALHRALRWGRPPGAGAPRPVPGPDQIPIIWKRHDAALSSSPSWFRLVAPWHPG